METKANTKITISTTVKRPVAKVWELWTGPAHIMRWNNASDDWHTPHAENDLRAGGKFLSRMEARDGSFGFDFSGKYTAVKPNELIAYVIDDGREVKTTFTAKENETRVETIFEAENSNPVEMQRDGWQAIMNNFKKYAESV